MVKKILAFTFSLVMVLLVVSAFANTEDAALADSQDAAAEMDVQTQDMALPDEGDFIEEEPEQIESAGPAAALSGDAAIVFGIAAFALIALAGIAVIKSR